MMTSFKDLCKALELTESEHDEHAHTIRRVLKTPGFDVNMLEEWGECRKYRSPIHVACHQNIRSHVGAQLLLSDERCDVNLLIIMGDDAGRTALMTAVERVKCEDDNHAKIVRLLLAHPRINVNKRGSMGETALHSACVDNVESHVGVQLLLSDERCDVNLRNENDSTALMEAVTNVSSHIVAKFNFAKWLPKRKKVDINYVKKHSAPPRFVRRQRLRPEFSSSSEELDVVKLFLQNTTVADLTDGNGKIEVVKFRASFYAAVASSINIYLHKKLQLHVQPNCLLIQDKISSLRLTWNGEFFNRMNVYVDIVPAVQSDDEPDKPAPLGVKLQKLLLIPKQYRHEEADHSAHFDVSHSSTEQAVIAALPLNVKHGLVLAKAARIASIARPAEDLTSHYGLQEDIHVDDFITSYILKTCLMLLLPRHSQTNNCSEFCYTAPECQWLSNDAGSACDWAIRIYELLKRCLELKHINTLYGNKDLVDCLECKAERGCCKKRKLTLAMTSQILNWLKCHQKELSKIGEVECKILVYCRQSPAPRSRSDTSGELFVSRRIKSSAHFPPSHSLARILSSLASSASPAQPLPSSAASPLPVSASPP